MTLSAVIAELCRAVASGRFTLSVVPRRTALSACSWREVEVSTLAARWVCPVDDEFRDADTNNPAAWLHLVLSTLDFAEEEVDPQVWARDVGLPPNALALSLHQQLRDLVVPLRDCIGTDVKAVPDWDMQMNTDVAQALRALARPPST